MLLLVTVLLVVVGAISLGIGFVQSETVPIFVSIGCSIVAGALLLIFTRMTAKTQKSDSSSGSPEAVPATEGTGFLGRPSSEETFGGSAAVARYADDDDEPAIDDPGDDPGDDPSNNDDFPIDRYDSRRVGEILPLLAELDVDELDVVREREERGKGRATVLARIDQLIEQLEAEDSDEAEHRFDAPPDDEFDDAAARPASPPVRVAALPMDDDYFPIEDYDDLRASEILPLLPELDDDELDMVRERERTGSARASILHRVDALLDVESADAGPGPVPYEEPEPEPVAPVRKTRATRAPAAKALPVPARAVKVSAARTVKAAPVKATPVKATTAKASLVKTPLVKTSLVKTSSKAPRLTKAAPAAAKASARKVPAARASMPAAKTVKAAAPAKVTKAPTQKRTATPSSTPTSKVTKKAAKR